MPPSPNGWLIKVSATLVCVGTIGVIGFAFGHVQSDGHSVALERSSTNDEAIKGNLAAINAIGSQITAGLIVQERQTVLLQSIDKRLAKLEP